MAAGALTLVGTSAIAQEPTKAIAVLHSTQGNHVEGIVTFTKSDDAVKIVADVTGLTPGKHGFHIHEFGDCSSPDGKAAGGHFNPMNSPHAGHDAAERHEGDLGNLEADSSGKAHLELTDKMMTMSGEKSIVAAVSSSTRHAPAPRSLAVPARPRVLRERFDARRIGRGRLCRCPR